ncbi:hypothetical protein [Frankia sp. Cr1]|uniref:hypothetical protein n=1 Tax=Frankia sp. Cr1 TaxID=3073931 RepID=UPI002AD2F9A2|nr:hypothetical protein [Frankia sp. Cr1]
MYRLVQQTTAFIAPAEMAWVVADRAIAAAQEADDPTALAAAAWNWANILRSAVYPEEALKVVTDAAALLQPFIAAGTDNSRAIYGALQLHAAVTAAREGLEGDAWRFWDKADEIAKKLPNGYVESTTVFSRANVDFHAVSVATELRTAGKALAFVDKLDPDSMPSKERRSRLWVEVARGYLQRGEHISALHVLKIAYSISPETVIYTPAARHATTEVWLRSPRGLRGEAAELGREIGVTLG